MVFSPMTAFSLLTVEQRAAENTRHIHGSIADMPKPRLPPKNFTYLGISRVLAVAVRNSIFLPGVAQRPHQSIICSPDSPWLLSQSSR